MPDQELPQSLNLMEVIKYAALVEQVIATVKSLKGSQVGTIHQMPTVKTWVGDAYWEADLGTWRRVK